MHEKLLTSETVARLAGVEKSQPRKYKKELSSLGLAVLFESGRVRGYLPGAVRYVKERTVKRRIAIKSTAAKQGIQELMKLMNELDPDREIINPMNFHRVIDAMNNIEIIEKRMTT